MAAKLCMVCESRGGIQHMKGTTTQKFVTDVQPEIIEWVCPYCGFNEIETNHFQAIGGTYNSGVGYVMPEVADPA